MAAEMESLRRDGARWLGPGNDGAVQAGSGTPLARHHSETGHIRFEGKSKPQTSSVSSLGGSLQPFLEHRHTAKASLPQSTSPLPPPPTCPDQRAHADRAIRLFPAFCLCLPQAQEHQPV